MNIFLMSLSFNMREFSDFHFRLNMHLILIKSYVLSEYNFLNYIYLPLSLINDFLVSVLAFILFICNPIKNRCFILKG